MDEGERELQNMRETSGLMYDDMVSEFLGGDRSRPQPTAADRSRPQPTAVVAG